MDIARDECDLRSNDLGTTLCEAESERETYRRILRKRMLMYGFITSVIGLPLGLALSMPYVWRLATAGICIGGTRLLLLRQKERK